MAFLNGLNPQGYSLSCQDRGVSCLTVFSGIVYAKRHWSVWTTQEGASRGHLALAVIEAIPVVGGLVALIERVAFYLFQNTASPPVPNAGQRIVSPLPMHVKPSPSMPAAPSSAELIEQMEKKGLASQKGTEEAQSPEEAFPEIEEYLKLHGEKAWCPKMMDKETCYSKMKKNAQKAVKEHLDRAPQSERDFYASEQEIAASETEALQEFSKPDFSYHAFSLIGGRQRQEDAYFYEVLEGAGALAAVFDGHGSSSVADYACDNFSKKFHDKYKEKNKNVRLVFEEVIHEMQSEIIGIRELDNFGAVGVVCFFESSSKQVYTATLGDSEASLYRKFSGTRKSIPLSCVRDWGCPKEALRAAAALKIRSRNPDTQRTWYSHFKQPNPKNSKCIKFPTGGSYVGINISRSLGDWQLYEKSKIDKLNGLTCKPKITVRSYRLGDVFLLVSDGVRDALQESDVISKLEGLKPTENIAENLVWESRSKSNDNLTAIVIAV